MIKYEYLNNLIQEPTFVTETREHYNIKKEYFTSAGAAHRR